MSSGVRKVPSAEAPSATGTAQGAAAAGGWPADYPAIGGGVAGGNSCFSCHTDFILGKLSGLGGLDLLSPGRVICTMR